MVPVPKTNYLRDTFRLLPEQWVRIWEFQDGKCAICGRDLLKSKCLTDHDHKTGLVRGLLCFRCNSFYSEDVTVDFLQKWLTYLLNPPASVALGHPHYGFPGRVGTKAMRALARKVRKAEKHAPIRTYFRKSQ